MKADTVLYLMVGMIAGGLIVTYCNSAQKAIKKGGEIVKDEAKNVIEKVKNQ